MFTAERKQKTMNWDEAIKELDNRRQRALAGGGQSKIDKQHAGGKMTARERIEVLLDPGTFVEVDGFIESRIDDFDLDKRRVPGDGVVTGYGEIDGRQVFVASEEFTVIGDVEKHAERNKVMKINEQWEELKEETHANIQSEKGILKRQIRSIQTEGHFGDIKENEKFRRFHYRSTEKVYKEFMLYAIGRNINKYHRFLHNEISKFEGKNGEKAV